MKKNDETALLQEIVSELISCINEKMGEKMGKKNVQNTQILELTLRGDICKILCPNTGRCKLIIEDGQIVDVVCLD